MNSDQKHRQALYHNYERRLRELEKKHAIQGINTPSEILIEMEDIRITLDELKQKNIITPLNTTYQAKAARKSYQTIIIFTATLIMMTVIFLQLPIFRFWQNSTAVSSQTTTAQASVSSISTTEISSTAEPIMIASVESGAENNIAAASVLINQPVRGVIAVDQTVSYSISGSANTPVLISIQTESNQGAGRLDYQVRIIDNKKEELLSQYYTGETFVDFAFTPPVDGDYSIELIGQQASGIYSLATSFLAGDASSRNVIKPIVIKELQEGVLAVGAVERFNFDGFSNTPIIVDIQTNQDDGSGRLDYQVRIIDNKKKELFSQYYTGETSVQFAYTPPNNEVYTMELIGQQSYGKYSIFVDLLSGDMILRNNIKPLTTGQIQEGIIAIGATERFIFKGTSSTAVTIEIQTNQDDGDGRLDYQVRIVDVRSRELLSKYNIGETNSEISFIPPLDGEYTLELIGLQSYGKYILSISPEERP